MKFSFSLEEEGNKGQGCYVVVALSALVFVLIWEWLWPNVIPFTLVEFWNLIIMHSFLGQPTLI